MQQRRCPLLRWAVAGVHMLYVYLMISMLLKRCVPFLSGSRRRGTALFARMRAAEAPPREAAARSPGEAAARFPMTEVDGEANTEMPKPKRVRFREDDAKELKRSTRRQRADERHEKSTFGSKAKANDAEQQKQQDTPTIFNSRAILEYILDPGGRFWDPKVV